MIHDILSIIWLPVEICLLVANVKWAHATVILHRAVRGSLYHEAAKIECRFWRWPGASLYPALTVWNLWSAVFEQHSPLGRGICLGIGTLFIWISRRDIRELIRQVKDDDDDWTNKTKRAAKKLAHKISTASKKLVPTAPVPQPAGV